MSRRALITGINGMDGSYMADKLLKEGWEVFGLERRTSNKNRLNTKHLVGKITFVNGDLTDQNSLLRALNESNPDVVFNYAAQSFVGESWNTPEQTADVSGVGALRMLEAIREYNKDIKFYQASTSEMFGKGQETPQRETTPFYPRSPYGVAKVYGYWLVRNYRESYNIFGCNGILFNHESPRRGELFVTRKITKTLSEIKVGIKKGPLELGNMDAKRDWGHAKDYVRGMWMMLQADTPDDYVLSMEEQHSVRDFVNISCKNLGFDIEWTGDGIDEVGTDKNTGKVIVQINPEYYRPAEVETLIGDCTKVKTALGWKPEYSFEQLVNEMCESDLKIAMEKKNDFVY